MGDKNRSSAPHFRTQDVNWDESYKFLDNNFSQFISSFPNEVRNITDDQANLFVNIITTSASSFFSITEKSKREIKGWWCKAIKKAKNDLKNANNRYKKDSHLPA